MSVFTNRKSDAAGHAGAYTQALLELLGDRDPMEVMEEQADWLLVALDGLGDDALRRPEAPGKWCILEVLRHLADSEVVHRYRLRHIVAEPGCAVVGYDQDAWATRLRYRDDAPDQVLRELVILRQANLDWLRGLTEEEWAREGVHDERGPESVRHLVRLLGGHDLLHRAQIERIRAGL